MSQAFYRKWRPQEWDQLVGQQHIVQTLRNAIASQRIAHAYMFAGPRGTGKTTTARLLAKAANCLLEDTASRPCNQCENCIAVNEGRFLDLIEIDAASNTSVEDVRSLRDKINFAPNQGRFKVYLIDEVHMLSTAAFNALLKTLEEPPSHAIFILATTEVHKIPATVLSRCQRHEFRRIPVVDMVKYLGDKTQQEGLEIEPEALQLIARQATGSLRDGISLLDQLASIDRRITLLTAQTVLGTATNQAVIELVEAILQNNPANGLDLIHQVLDSGTDSRQFARQIVEYLRSLMLIKLDDTQQLDVTPEQRSQMQAYAGQLTTERSIALINLFNDAANDSRTQNWQPGLPLELAFASSLETANPAFEPQVTLQSQIDAGIPVAPTAATESSHTPQPIKASDIEQTNHKKASKPKAVNAREEPKAQAAPRTQTSQPSSYGTDHQPTPAGTSQPTITLRDITHNWRTILSQVRQHGHKATQPLLNSCKPLGIKDGRLILGFRSDFAKSQIEKGEHIQITRQIIHQVLGVDLPIYCILINSEQSEIPADLGIANDSVVGTALRDFGGQLSEVHELDEAPPSNEDI